MSSPPGGSPGAEPQAPTATQPHNIASMATISDVDRSIPCQWRSTQYGEGECARFIDCPSHNMERTQPAPVEEVNRRESDVEDEALATITTTARTTDDESHADQDSDADRLASQLSLLGARFGGPNQVASADSPEDEAGPSTAPQHAQPTFPPPRSTSHIDPLRHPINLDNSLPPTPREENPAQEFGTPPSRSGRRRSTVTFRDEHGDEQGSSSVSFAVRDYNMARQGSFPAGPTTGRRVPQPISRETQDSDGSQQTDFVLPRWQPDAEVTYCPICQTQFSIFVRKHHCRKCGRVVCNSCSPHRIIIPHQYIVRPPGSEVPNQRAFLYEGLVPGYLDGNGPSGGERVRLCNPCVPDPQTAPPQSPSAAMGGGSIRSAHQRSRSSFAGNYGTVSSSNRYPGSYAESRGSDQWRRYSAGTRSIAMATGGRAGPSGSSSRIVHHGSLQRLAQSGSSYPTRHSSLASVASSSRNRTLPPTPQIAEEDECPICHRELPSRELPNFEAAREAHINACIQNHSTYGSPRLPAPGGTEPPGPPPPLRRTGMYKYVATEKDCIDDAECTICLEEFTVGVGMARLECLCRFHRSCISAWFVNHPGRCPVHQHDGFGF